MESGAHQMQPFNLQAEVSTRIEAASLVLFSFNTGLFHAQARTARSCSMYVVPRGRHPKTASLLRTACSALHQAGIVPGLIA